MTNFKSPVINRKEMIMTNLMRAFNAVMLVMLVGAILAMSACSKTDENGVTVGQKVDHAIDKTNAAVDDAQVKLQADAAQAKARVDEVADKARANVNNESAHDEAGKVRTVVDDSLITASVKADLLKEKDLNAFHVDVATTEGAVTLSGKVATQAAKQRAEQVAMLTDGVAKVNNQLTIDPKQAYSAQASS